MTAMSFNPWPAHTAPAGYDCGSKPTHDIRIDEFTRLDEVEYSEHCHSSTTHDFHPVVQIWFVIKYGEPFFNHAFDIIAHVLRHNKAGLRDVGLNELRRCPFGLLALVALHGGGEPCGQGT